jgi:hypothetical protein
MDVLSYNVFLFKIKTGDFYRYVSETDISFINHPYIVKDTPGSKKFYRTGLMIQI